MRSTISILHLLALSILISSVFGNGNEKCSVCGQYKLVSNPKDPAMDEVWKAMGFSEEARKQFSESNNITLTVRRNDTKYCVETQGNKCGNYKYSFTANEEFTLNLCDGRELTAVVKVDEGDRKLTYTLQFGDHIGTKIAEYKGKMLTHSYTIKDKKGEQQYMETANSKDSEWYGALKKFGSMNSPKSSTKGDDKKDKNTKANIALLPISVEV